MFFIDLTLEKNPLERCKKDLSNLSSRFKKKLKKSTCIFTKLPKWMYMV